MWPGVACWYAGVIVSVFAVKVWRAWKCTWDEGLQVDEGIGEAAAQEHLAAGQLDGTKLVCLRAEGDAYWMCADAA